MSASPDRVSSCRRVTASSSQPAGPSGACSSLRPWGASVATWPTWEDWRLAQTLPTSSRSPSTSGTCRCVDAGTQGSLTDRSRVSGTTPIPRHITNTSEALELHVQGQADPWNRFRGTCCSYPELVTVFLTHSPGKQLMPSLEALHLQGHGCARRLGPCWVMATTSRPRVRRRPELGVPVGLSRGTAAVEDRPPPAGAPGPLWPGHGEDDTGRAAQCPRGGLPQPGRSPGERRPKIRTGNSQSTCSSAAGFLWNLCSCVLAEILLPERAC